MAFVSVGKVEDVPQGASACFKVGSRRVAVFHLEDGFYAIDDICSHEEAYLCEGEVFGDQVACPKHGARFDIRTGQALTLPAVLPVDTFELKIEDGEILIREP